MPEQGDLQRETVTLGQYLLAVRKDRGMTLRQVEEATNGDVSNPYLSQLENDKIKQPSPHILHSLAELYAINYEGLMERAGYIRPKSSRSDEARHSRAATFADLNLSGEEEAELLRFLRFLRSSKPSSGAS